MADLQKTIDNDNDNWSESSEDEDFQVDDKNFEVNNNFFSDLTQKSVKKSKLSESTTKINAEITEQILEQTKTDLKTKTTTTNEKIDKLKNKKKHKLSLEQDDIEEVDEKQQKKMQNEEDDEEEENKESQEKKVKTKTWGELQLGKPLLKACDDLEYIRPTKIQELCIPAIVSGKDVLASSLTGSGKTGAFLLPIIQKIYRSQPTNYSKALIVLPTRELAFQCYEMFQNFNKYTKLNACLVIGQSSMQKQEAELRRFPEFIIATPGRLLDHLQNSQSFDLDNLEVLVFDEADKLLDLGFTAEVNQIAKESNKDRQTLLFSATLNSDVNKLINLALKKPIKLHANPDSSTSDKLKQFVLKISNEEQREASLLALVTRFYKTQTMIFFRTKVQCHKMAIIFGLLGLKVCELHGNLSQSQRIKAFEDYKNGEYDYLMATDLAARGLDIKELKAVINFEIPQEVTRYIHRVGRTARAGKKGVCVTICSEHDILKLKRMMKKNRDQLQKVHLEDKVIRQFQQKISSLDEDIKNIFLEEKAESQLRKAEIEANKAQNLIDHKEDIYNRPKKEWFQSYRDKNEIQKSAKEALENAQFEDEENFYDKNFLGEDQKQSQNQNQQQQKQKQQKNNNNNNNNNKKRKFQQEKQNSKNQNQKGNQKQKFQNSKKNQQFNKKNNNTQNKKVKK